MALSGFPATNSFDSSHLLDILREGDRTAEELHLYAREKAGHVDDRHVSDTLHILLERGNVITYTSNERIAKYAVVEQTEVYARHRRLVLMRGRTDHLTKAIMKKREPHRTLYEEIKTREAALGGVERAPARIPVSLDDLTEKDVFSGYSLPEIAEELVRWGLIKQVENGYITLRPDKDIDAARMARRKMSNDAKEAA